MARKTWFITGTSRGFGRTWCEAALQRGDRVAATARNVRSLDDLVAKFGDLILPLPLNVDSRTEVEAAVQKAHAHFGRIDVVINNAGYGLFGAVEDISEEQARAQFDTNFFGLLWVTRAVLPIMRNQGAGHILQVSSIGGLVAWPLLGLYHATKFAVEGLSESLAQEVAPLGIHVTLIEPGSFATDWDTSSAHRIAPSQPYAPLLETSPDEGVPAEDVVTTVETIFTLVDQPDPPLRIFLGTGCLDMANDAYQERLRVWRQGDPKIRP